MDFKKNDYIMMDGKRLPIGLKDDDGCVPVLCPVCHKYVFMGQDDEETCPFCGWNNEWLVPLENDSYSQFNYLTLGEARANYQKFGLVNNTEDCVSWAKTARQRYEKRYDDIPIWNELPKCE